jgi:NAD(P)H-quinone oxidoreductase subunit 5
MFHFSERIVHIILFYDESAELDTDTRFSVAGGSMVRLLEWLPWAPSGLYLVGALLAASTGSQGWLAVTVATRGALASAVVTCAIALCIPDGSLAHPGAGVAAIVTALIAFLGWIIGDYSRRYLRGEPGQTRFSVAFLATLAAVSTVVVSAHLAVIIAAWAGSSAGLHHLLTFYRERPAAIIVAHKKFLTSRLAEGLLAVAALLLYRQWGTLDVAAITARAQAGATLPSMAGVAAVLVAAAVLLKCAQLPLHGWLIQVMEAPTPVSALLHAGVVNLGGYVLIRLGPLIGASPAAQALLVVVGSLTAALAGLVMLTRITIKVRLAWSTCSQMGFMVMECGLGLYDLALLHLLAHALYKAHAFLTAGEAVRNGLERQLIAPIGSDVTRLSLFWPMLALPIAWIVAAGSAVLWHQAFGLPTVPWIATALLACGLATLLWSPTQGRRANWKGLPALIAGVQLYLGWHWLLTERIGVAALPPSTFLATWCLLVFVALYALQLRIAIRRHAAPPARLYDWIYAGLYLDERLTRLTFRLWPARASSRGLEGSADPGLAHPGSTA